MSEIGAPIAWGRCQKPLLADVDASVAASVDCGTIELPSSYARADGPTVTVAMARHRTTSAKRIGSLLINPGGPGGSGREFLFTLLKEPPAGLATVIDRFDVIGFDPRGVGASGQIRCLPDKELDAIFTLDITPESPEEEAASDALDDAFDKGCLTTYGNNGLLALNTENVARDMNEIRRSVGDRGLNFLGVSYGTYLGAVYATLFPGAVRALVLDGAYDPTGQDRATQSEISLGGREDAFKNWETWCATSLLCAFGEGADVDARWLALRTKLDTTPAKGRNGREANQGVFMAATGISLYNREYGWIALGSALKAAEEGDGELLLQLADSAFGRRKDGTYDGRIQASGVISCASGISPPPAPDPLDAARRIRASSPHFAIDVKESDLADSTCGKLPEGPPAPAISYRGSAQVLVVGGANDPATPFVWATKMANALGPNARLLRFEGEGHGAVLDSPCVAAHAASLLVDLRQVPTGATCVAPEAQRASVPGWFAALPSIPGAVDADVSDLAPLLGFDPSRQAVVMKVTTRDRSVVSGLVTEFRRRGWVESSDGATLRLEVDGEIRRVVVGQLDLRRLARLEPMMAPMARRLLKIGASIVFIGDGER